MRNDINKLIKRIIACLKENKLVTDYLINANNKKTVEELFASSMVAGFIHGFIALNEYIEASPIPDTWLDPMSKDIFRTRCAGIFTDPNVFAAYLSVVFIFTIVVM